ncbi:MAG: glutamate-5-semialdehyde dehydrogenase [Lachnospiraceae bacterium]|nr:glutamate-5-semialdehyde dehydrogenase [Lachnospiraceae bacterium]
MKIREAAHDMKLAAPILASTTIGQRNGALRKIAEALEDHKAEIFEANKKDMDAAEKNNIAAAVKKRLKYDEGKLRDGIAGIEQLIELPDPLGKLSLNRQLDEGLILKRVSVPIGVIGVIFEARPDALVQISALCIKSGNCAVLKGGKETVETNRILFKIIYDSVVEAGLPEGCLLQAELHNEIDELLTCDGDIDLLIPRGSNKFVRYIMENTKIPVMGHSSGICHIYLDKDCDMKKAIPIIVDAKIQYPAACNAVETLLVNRDIAKEALPEIAEALTGNGVRLRGTEEVSELISCEIMAEDEFDTEYTDLIISIKLVSDVKEAVEHINRYSSHHTDSILTENDEAAEYFMNLVDSAGVYHNCSTRFSDGYRYGFGAEVGISTGKLHARGPVGLEGLVTYKYKLFGSGQVVGDYASGKSHFHHKDI